MSSTLPQTESEIQPESSTSKDKIRKENSEKQEMMNRLRDNDQVSTASLSLGWKNSWDRTKKFRALFTTLIEHGQADRTGGIDKALVNSWSFKELGTGEVDRGGETINSMVRWASPICTPHHALDAWSVEFSFSSTFTFEIVCVVYLQSIFHEPTLTHFSLSHHPPPAIVSTSTRSSRCHLNSSTSTTSSQALCQTKP